MSRVHEALRKAANESQSGLLPPNSPASPIRRAVFDIPAADTDVTSDVFSRVETVPYKPLPEALLVNVNKPREAPGEEFRSLSTRLNHLQTTQQLRALVVTSASPAEGKSFTAANLAMTQAQLANKRILLADFDFRRPTVEKTFQLSSSPGVTDYLRGAVPFEKAIRKLESTNLYVMTAGQIVPNPLELLNLAQCPELIAKLKHYFDWVIIDSPPLLFAADANLLATMCDGTILVVRIGATTFETVSRAIQSLCENNVLGIIVNGARRSELYSKYSYYYGQPSNESSKEA